MRAWSPALRLVLSLAALTALSCAVGLLLGGRTTAGETAFLDSVMDARNPGATALAQVWTTFGSLLLLGPAAAAVAVLLLVRGRTGDVLVVAATVVGAVASVVTVKALVDRPRPSVPALAEVASAGFPSQHAAQSAAILTVLAVVLTGPGRGRTAVLALTASVVLGVGATRVYLGVHHPSDVAAGWLLGLAWAGCVLLILRPRVDGPANAAPGERGPGRVSEGGATAGT